MALQYSFFYGLSTAFFGWLDKATLNIGGYFSGSSPGFSTMFSTAAHAALATWFMDNAGIGIGVGSQATRYLYIPAAAGAANALFGAGITGWINQHDSGNADVTSFLGEAVSAAVGVYIFSAAV